MCARRAAYHVARRVAGRNPRGARILYFAIRPHNPIRQRGRRHTFELQLSSPDHQAVRTLDQTLKGDHGSCRARLHLVALACCGVYVSRRRAFLGATVVVYWGCLPPAKRNDRRVGTSWPSLPRAVMLFFSVDLERKTAAIAGLRSDLFGATPSLLRSRPFTANVKRSIATRDSQGLATICWCTSRETLTETVSGIGSGISVRAGDRQTKRGVGREVGVDVHKTWDYNNAGPDCAAVSPTPSRTSPKPLHVTSKTGV